MSDDEYILKITWGSKKIKNPFKLMEKYTEKEIIKVIEGAYNNKNKGKRDKIEILTSTPQENGTATYKYYHFDQKTPFEYKDCNVMISIKSSDSKKNLTFEEKIGLLKLWVSKHNKTPKAGDMENNFDVGKFYQQSINNADKMKEVIAVVKDVENEEEE